jgi:hypothetical protein
MSGTIRTNKREDQYARISRYLLQDNELTFESRGLAAYLLSKPENWEIDIENLVRESPSGRDVVYRMIRELRDAGYMIREETRKSGRFHYDYTLYESKELAALHQPMVCEVQTELFDQSGLPVLKTSTGEPIRLTSTGNPYRSCKEEKTTEQTTESETKEQTTEQSKPVVVVDFSEEQISAYAQEQANIENPVGFTKSVLDGTAKDMPRILQSIGEWLESHPPRTTAPLEVPEIDLPGESPPELLADFMSALLGRVNDTSYARWFKPIEAMSRGETTVYFRVSDGGLSAWISQYYEEIVRETLEAMGLAGYEFEFIVSQKSAVT